MYERGVQDAAHDDLNPFYYQHYYYYRRGYDDMRRRLRRAMPAGEMSNRHILPALIGVFVVLAVVIGASMLSSGGSRGTDTGETPPVSSAGRSAGAALGTRRPRTATPSPPTATPEPILHVGGEALVVNVGDSPLRARREPGVNQPVQARFPDNARVRIVEGPVEADGYVWWRVEGPEGSGWSAERSLEGVVWLQPQE